MVSSIFELFLGRSSWIRPLLKPEALLRQRGAPRGVAGGDGGECERQRTAGEGGDHVRRAPQGPLFTLLNTRYI